MMFDLLGNRTVKGNVGNTVFLSHSYKVTGNIPHGNCKFSQVKPEIQKSHKSGAWKVGE